MKIALFFLLMPWFALAEGLNITGPEVVEINEEVTFGAEAPPSMNLSSFFWQFGDGNEKWGKTANHSYSGVGEFDITLSVKASGSRERTEVKKSVLVYDRMATLVFDTHHKDRVSYIENQAAKEGIWLQKIELENQSSAITSEQVYLQAFQENAAAFEASDQIIFFTAGLEGIQSFSQYWQKLSEEKRFDVTGKSFYLISDENLDRIERLLTAPYRSLGVEYILMTRPEAVNPIFVHRDLESLKAVLETRSLEFELFDGRNKGYLPFSKLMTYFVTNGISPSSLYILLSVPFIAFTIAFFRQVVGVSTFGVFAPLMLAMSFLVLGIKFGLVVFLMVMLVSTVLRFIFERVDLMYIPKVSLLLSFLALSFFMVLALAVYFGTSLNLALAVFPMMVMSTISERFVASQSSDGIRNALFGVGETVVVALVAYIIIEWDVLQQMIISLPELIIVPILGTAWLGTFTGLRLSELIKFRSLLTDETQE